MRQLLLLFISLLLYCNQTHAINSNPYEMSTWKVISERLFNGKNSKVYRYEKDIRLQLIGVESQQDSALFIEMIAELNKLLETVEVTTVDDNPNFILKISFEDGGWSMNKRQTHSGTEITHTTLELGFPDNSDDSRLSNRVRYYTFRNLTKLFNPKFGHSGYGGIFDSQKPEDSKYHEIDKTLLRKVYSNNFYPQLKKNTIKTKGVLFYLNLRYKGLVENLLFFIVSIITIITFLLYLSGESKREQNPSLGQYIKQRSLLVFIFVLSYQLPQMLNNISSLHWKTTLILSSFVLVVLFFYGLITLTLIYYIERHFLKRINGFISKQIFIFLNTILSVLFIAVILSLGSSATIKFSSSSGDLSTPINSIFLQSPSRYSLVLFIAGIRVLYNFLSHRLQGIVNAKDVEIAKMRELKNQAELNALHSRINPHFLYNSLNSIAGLAHINPDKTEDMATGLSELFRYSINKENKTFVSVEEEIEMVTKYLEIEKTRFGDRLIYDIFVEDDAKQKNIPKFLIQPIVENAIKHGISKSKEVGEISIIVERVKNNMVISIYDNGPDFPDEPISGYGLQNIYDKLAILYGENGYINWENGEQKHFRITLKNQF